MRDQAATVLIVDDVEANRIMLREFMVALGHRPVLAPDGASALEAMAAEPPDLVLLDIRMPGMSGLDVLKAMRSNRDLHAVPVIVVSAVDDMADIVRCIELGAEDYLAKPLVAAILGARVRACLRQKRSHDRERAYRLEIERNNVDLEARVAEQVRELTRANLATIFAMSKLAEFRDEDTGHHLERIREYTRVLCRELARLEGYADVITPTFVENMYSAGALHDIGKVGIPDRILLKPGRLTGEEFEVMKTHVLLGGRALREVARKHPGNQLVNMGIEITESHHEKWNGRGYPHGLAGEAIPLGGRIICVADVYDALTSKRPYKAAFTHERSLGIIVEGRGEHFAPAVVDALVARKRDFLAIRQSLRDPPSKVAA